MLRALLLAAAVLTMGAAPAAKPAAPKSAVAKPAPPKPAAPRAALDSRDPASLVGLLNVSGAKAELSHRDEGAVLVAVTSTAANFSAQFAECDRQGRNCRAAVYDAALPGSATLSQINGFNQASALCRAYLDRMNKPHVTMPVLLFADDTREHMVTALGGWQGCLGDFGAFLKDPNGYLAAALKGKVAEPA
jgi:hypothetical protein